MQSPLLSISNLSVGFESRDHFSPVLQDFSLILHSGSCVGLVGESGSGKTISALSMLQLLPPSARVSNDSQILFRGHDLLNFSEKEMRHVRGKKIGMIFQDAMSALNPVLTIGEQLRETIQLHLRLTSRDTKSRGLSLLERVGITDLERAYRSYPHELSGGMRQRAMIAIAIAAEPEIIIADEPTTALDVHIQSQVINLLIDLKKEKHCALLFIGHDLSVIAKIADDITVLKSGHIVEQSDARSFFAHPREAYSRELLEAVLVNAPKQIETTETRDMLRVDNLKQYFPIRSGVLKRVTGYVKAVDDISFTVKKGETVAIVGESGSGKTTAVKSVLQLLKNTDGAVYLEERALRDLSSKQLREKRSDMQIIFQDPFAALDPRMTIFESLCEGLLIQKKVKNKKAAHDIVDLMLNQVELPAEFKKRYPHEFSGGQRQRICIARALALSPKLLILDEPTSALDVATQKQILMLLEKLQQEKKLSYLLITHNFSVVAYLAHHVIVMRQGKIIEAGTARDVLQSPQNDYTKQLLAAV